MTEQLGSSYEICLWRLLIGRFLCIRRFLRRPVTPAELCDVSGFRPAPVFPERSVSSGIHTAERSLRFGRSSRLRLDPARLRASGLVSVLSPEECHRFPPNKDCRMCSDSLWIPTGGTILFGQFCQTVQVDTGLREHNRADYSRPQQWLNRC